MTTEPNPLLASLRAAVAAAPNDVPLRVHLAELLAAAGDRGEAVRHAATVLTQDPTNAAALVVIAGVPAAPAGPAPSDPATALPGAVETPLSEAETLSRLDSELAHIAPPMYAEPGPEQDAGSAFDVEATGLRLADVGGMTEVKARLEAGFLAPLRNPELVRLYGKSLRGGLLLYGPPGCGKTFIARALAGEMGANFVSVGLSDVLDMYIGQSERNISQIFDTARRNAPCVLFLDEVDALGQKRTQLRNSAARGVVNQLLTELDGVANTNDGLYVLGATNHPWDVDVALRRPGRFDRMVFVGPPDEPARESILRYHLRQRPIAKIEPRKLAKSTEGYSGADLAYICETAAEQALLDSARTGNIRMIEMRDLEAALRDVKPSIGPWLDTARNVAQFANEGGAYDEVLAYLRKRRLV